MALIRRLTVATAVGLLVVAEAATAQVAGIPVYYNPGGGTGFGVAANVGTVSGAASEGKAYALSGALGNGPFYLTASAGRWNPDVGETQNTFGATASMRVFGGGLLPLAVAAQVGFGYMKADSITSTDIPVGIGIALNPPLFPIKPWIAPRVQFSRRSNGASATGTSFGVSAGVNFNLMLGLGFHAAVDVLKVNKDIDPSERTATTVGVGAHFNFRVPMM